MYEMSKQIESGVSTGGGYKPNGIYLADCYEAIKQIPDKSIDLIVTDPPYELSVGHGSGAFGVKKKLHYEQFVSLSNGINYAILDEFVRVLKKINLYIWCSKKQIDAIKRYFVTDRNCYYELICWHKPNVVPACNNKYMSDTEYCLFFREKGVKLYGTAETKATFYVQPINMVDKKRFQHPTIKPLNIIQNLIINSSKPGDIVLDPFVGSGTTAVAARNLGRQYIGFEINEKYYKIATNRLNNIDATGQMSIFTI